MQSLTGALSKLSTVQRDVQKLALQQNLASAQVASMMPRITSVMNTATLDELYRQNTYDTLNKLIEAFNWLVSIEALVINVLLHLSTEVYTDVIPFIIWFFHFVMILAGVEPPSVLANQNLIPNGQSDVAAQPTSADPANNASTPSTGLAAALTPDMLRSLMGSLPAFNVADQVDGGTTDLPQVTAESSSADIFSVLGSMGARMSARGDALQVKIADANAKLGEMSKLNAQIESLMESLRP